MTEQQREAFEAWYNEEYVRPIIPADRTEGGYQHPDAQAAWDAWQASLSHAEGEAVDLEIGAGDVLICDLGTASAAGVAFYRDNAAHDVGTHHPELSGMGGTELAGRIFSVMTEKPESLVVLYNAVGRALATLGHPAPHAEGEAFGWFTEDHDTDKSATTYDPVVAERWRAKGWPVWPLYTHPAPQVTPTLWQYTDGDGEERFTTIKARALEHDAHPVGYCVARPAPQVADTPAAAWRENGEADPHGDACDCPRSRLPLGNLTDDELANGVFLYGGAGGDGKSGIAWLTSAKERIRWLSRRLAEAEAAPQVAVPEGWKLARSGPVTINGEEFYGVRIVGPDGGDIVWENRNTSIVYGFLSAMLAAAPTAPAGEPEFYVEHKTLRSAMAYVGIAAPESDEALGAEMECHAKRVIRAAAKLLAQQPAGGADGDGHWPRVHVRWDDVSEADMRLVAERASTQDREAHEQPVSDPDGVPDRFLMPRSLTAENGAKTALSDEFFVEFGVRCARCGNPDFSLDLGQCAGCQHSEYEPSRRAVPWTTIKRIYSRAVELLGVPAPDEREIAALLERIVPRIDPQNPKPLDETEHCCECTLYYERERIHGEIARLRKLGGNHD